MDVDERGFTMIELLFVLFIVILMSSVIMAVGTKWTTLSEEDAALRSIVSTIYSLQAYAMAHEVNTRLIFRNTKGRMAYVAEVPGYYEITRNLLPEGMTLITSSNLMTVEFYRDGAIAKFGTIRFRMKDGSQRRITVQIARGRMMIGESKRLFLAGSDVNARHYNGCLWDITSSWYTFATANRKKENKFA